MFDDQFTTAGYCRAADANAGGMMSVTTTTAIGHCMKCTAQRDIKDIKHITLKNGRPAMEGSCAVCGTKMFKIADSE